MSPPSLGSKTSQVSLTPAGYLHELLFNPEDAGKMFLQNVSSFSTDYAALYSRRSNSATVTARTSNTAHKSNCNNKNNTSAPKIHKIYIKDYKNMGKMSYKTILAIILNKMNQKYYQPH
jgi:hypothetical protein